MKIKWLIVSWLSPLAILSSPSPLIPTAHAQGTAFTYQGQLSENGAPANGSYDLSFTLYDTNASGVPITGPVTNPVVNITNGLFTTVIDFGDAFTGTSNWLEIAASTNGANNFVTLAPRQALTPTPYAIMAESATPGAITSEMIASGAVTGDKIAPDAITGSDIDDGGSGGYQDFQQAVQGVGGDTTLGFSNLLAVATNGVNPSFALAINGSAFGTVIGFSGYEGISQPYYYVVEVSVPSAEANPDSQLGLTAQLSYSHSGRVTSFGGLVTACSLSGSNGSSFFYSVRIESPLAYLALKTDYRIYQDTNAPTLASGVYQAVTGYTPTMSLSGSYVAHNSLTQFGETSFNFFSRLLENEGVFYFFNQGATVPGLVLGDSPAAYLASPGSPFVYYGDAATNVPAAEYVRTFQKASHQSTVTSTVNSYNYTTPDASLLATANSPEGLEEDYQFGNDVQTLAYDQQLAVVRAGRQTAQRALMAGSSAEADLRAGYSFTLTDQSGAGLGGSYLVTAVHHAGFVRVTNGVSSWFYGNEFEAIPASLNFRPAVVTPRPQAQPCTAVVTGPSGQEIYVDSYGRVKVQFQWDRYGNYTTNSSAWLRVATPMASGNGRGMMFLPRIGDEVLVSFIQGDPDQPVVAGSLYNATDLPPYALPSKDTVSTIRSTGTPGEPSEINEIEFDDAVGSQLLALRAAKDFSVVASNNIIVQADANLTATVGGTANITSTGNLTVKTSGTATLNAGDNLAVTATGTASVTSTGNLTLQTSGTALVTAEGNLNLESSSVLNFEGSQTSVTGGMNIDQASQNNGGDSAYALTFGASSGEGIASKRTTGGTQDDLELCTASQQRLIILNNGDVGIGTADPIAPLSVQGDQTGGFADATVLISNTNDTESSGPALRVQWDGTASGNAYGVAALSVSANNLSGDIAEFGNSDTWVARIANDGAISATAFNTTSDRNLKENFRPVDRQAVLAKVVALPVTEWNYKAESASQRHLGPMAQDFHAAFGLNGDDDKHISVVDEGGVALAAIQGLNQKLEDQGRGMEDKSQQSEADIQRLETENANLKSQMDELRSRLDGLQKAVAQLTALSPRPLALNNESLEVK